MRIVKIPKKKKGEFRTIYCPNPEEKSVLRSMAGQISKKAERACPEGVAHGFMRHKSPVTNAEAHVGHKFTLCFDLKNFFDTVTPERLQGKLSKDEMALVIIDGAARQGLPTSPAVANLAASELDKAILKWRDKKKHQVVYTRYADDLAFSYDSQTLTELLKKEIPQIIKRCGFQVNPAKTHCMTATSGRRIITGVAVDNDGIHPTRKMKRKLRAALHQGNRNQAYGLAEWCTLKHPKIRSREQIKALEEIPALQKVWRLGKLPLDKLPEKPTEVLSENIIVTGDPVYMLGMSTWTTGWKSCMAQPSGQYRKGVLFWCFLRGTRIGALLSTKTMVVSGVERRTMRARTLVHELRNGTKCYDRIYGNPGDIEELKQALEKDGIVSIANARQEYGSVTVIGHAPSRFRPYLDNLKAESATAKTGPWKGQKVRIVKT